ncbi:MAG: 1,4-dihydroxy-6-naphthoate synthase [Desulfatiglans sp.]|nr:1,4-dihydroxy-6-naphthoate synthase [Thermodesulfobacteriota bacterium]MEE4352221.1 1,4-dihydroxy-6-naphthoate synthase [Desulfatiglans sp.]
MISLDIGFSPCPNDTYIFHAMLHHMVDTGPFKFISHVLDVEDLNHLAFEGTFPITKVSFYAYLLLKDRYDLLDSGSALGYGCGPLVVARKEIASLEDATLAVPGRHTTAFLLLQLWQPKVKKIEITRFDHILPGLASGKYDAGVIIHEGRFVYPAYQCKKVIDLGEWWECKTGLPIPLGCILLRKDMSAYKHQVESTLRASVEYAFAHPGRSRDYIKNHAQELDDQVIDNHISLYVNSFTLSLGETGIKSIHALEEMARCRKIL